MLCPYQKPLVDQKAITAVRCCVRASIRRGWFSPAEFEDLVQDAVVHLLTKADCFDSDRANWSTFCSIVVRSFLSRRRQSQVTRPDAGSLDESSTGETSDRYGQIEEQHCIGKRFQRLRSQSEWIELVEDVSRMLETLPTELRSVGERLRSDEGIAEIAEQLGVSRNTIYRRRQRIRECFRVEYMAEYR